jgi:hypothetical protein
MKLSSYQDGYAECRLYGPLIPEALRAWGEATRSLAVDPTMLWGQDCMMRLSVI